jgi:hypothetical protein
MNNNRSEIFFNNNNNNKLEQLLRNITIKIQTYQIKFIYKFQEHQFAN